MTADGRVHLHYVYSSFEAQGRVRLVSLARLVLIDPQWNDQTFIL